MGYIPGRLNFEIISGASWRTPLNVYDGTVTTTLSGLSPMNLTGFTGSCTLRVAPHQDPPLYQMTTDNGGIIINTTVSGSLALYIPASQTIGFTWPAAVYDLFLTDNNGNYFTAGDTIPYLTGSFKVKGNTP